MEHHMRQYHRSRLGVSQPKPFVDASPLTTWLLFSRRKRWILDNRGVILTLTPWLGAPLYLPWCFESYEKTGVRGLLKAHTRKHLASNEARTCDPLITDPSFSPIELSWLTFLTPNCDRYSDPPCRRKPHASPRFLYNSTARLIL